jgi:DNA-binding SARP family transcriptional activator
MEFRILGSLEAEAGGKRLALGGPRERKVLAVLLLDAGRVVPVTHLVEALWDDPPATAGKQVSNAVGLLRRLLAENGEPDLVVTEGSGYRLRVGTDSLDSRVFEAKVSQGKAAAAAGDVAKAAVLAGSALALWRGPVLAGLSGRVIEAAAAGWEERRCAVQETYYDHRLALGEHRQIVGDLVTAVSAYPLRERTVAQLMLALYRCGRQAEALAAYLRARDVVVAELGVEPGPGLRELHQQILSADPALAVTEPTRPAEAEPGQVKPRELPPTVPGFTGRSAELKALTGLPRLW